MGGAGSVHVLPQQATDASDVALEIALCPRVYVVVSDGILFQLSDCG
jgi:hypothetical protein